MKKADISINVIIMAVIGLVVLFILIMVFSNQISSAAAKYFHIGEDAADAAEGKACVSIATAGTRKCIKAGESCGEQWREIPPSQGSWKNCARCCERL